jgi:hypothetical protein
MTSLVAGGGLSPQLHSPLCWWGKRATAPWNRRGSHHHCPFPAGTPPGHLASPPNPMHCIHGPISCKVDLPCFPQGEKGQKRYADAANGSAALVVSAMRSMLARSDRR